MGKGDKRTKRGKLFRGSHGKRNPSNRHAAPAKPEPKPAAKPRTPREQPAVSAPPPAA